MIVEYYLYNFQLIQYLKKINLENMKKINKKNISSKNLINDILIK